ncbi:MAG: hypothetical protein J6J61_05145, partial [Muribaculaceae bacterium]|nr:hypothetical protein [Muribaculaceae bacterium]
ATGKTTLTVDMLKTVANYVGDSSLDVSPTGYTFGLYEKGGTLLSTVSVSSSDGKVTGSWEHSYIKDLQHGRNDTGAHSYYIKEIVPADPMPGLTYDNTEHWFTIKVADNGLGDLVIYSCDCEGACSCGSFEDDNKDGILAAEELYWELESDRGSEEIEFTNGFYPPPPPAPADPSVSVTLSASKTLDSVAYGDGKFSFELKDAKGNVVRTAVNGAGGVISFGSLTFDEAGTYEYSISEKAGADEGIEYDASVYKAVVTVTEDASGNLSAATAITKDGAPYTGTPAFANKTKYEPVEVALSATKTLDGKAPGSNAFLFTLSKDGAVVEKATNSASGAISFGALSFDTEGVYKYVLAEVAGSDEGFEYDPAIYEITVTVTKGEGNKLEAATAITKNGAAYSGTPAFANKTVEEEEKPDPELPDTGNDPKPDGPIAPTGDGSPILPLVVLIMAAAAGIAIALRMARRRA